MKDSSKKKPSRPAAERENNGQKLVSIHRILVPIDFSDNSKSALRYAVEFAAIVHAELLLVYVVEPAVYPADFSFGQVAMPDFENELRQRGEEGLKNLVREHVHDTVPSRTIVRTGKPFLEIIDAAEEENVDLIMIASHGHTGVEHILFGGTAEKVIRKARCPVFVIR